MTSEQIIERLLENDQITASEALQLLRDISSNIHILFQIK